MKRYIALTLMMLSGCGDMPGARSESEIEAIATDTATDATSPTFAESESRIGDLERKVGALERELASERSLREAGDDLAKRGHTYQGTAIDRPYENDRTFSARLGMPYDESK